MVWIIALGFLSALLLGGLLLAWYATQFEPYRPVLRRIAVPVPVDWPRLSILHLSDLHVATGGARLYRAQSRFLSSIPARPDLLCVTGDVCEQLDGAPLVAGLLAPVRPRVDTLVVLGNHEHGAPHPAGHTRTAGPARTACGWLARLASWLTGERLSSSGSAEAHAIAATLSEAGCKVLINEGVRLEIYGRSLWVAGSDSIWAGGGQSAAALRGRHDGEPCLGLVHEPEGAPALIARGSALALAGHTHGGQVCFPFAGAPYAHRLDPRIHVAAGVQRLGRGMLHISAGLGHTTPLRFNCPPEATWIECVPGPELPSQAEQPAVPALAIG